MTASRIVGIVSFLPALVASLTVTGCGGKQSASIKVDGSSTVHPITEAVAKEFKQLHPDVSISIGISGTGGGFKKFYAGETDISNASRPIKESEKEKCQEKGIEFLELRVGIDGLAVIIHKDNTWAKNMTIEQLRKIWHPNTDSFKNANTWSDVDPSWPNVKIDLYGAGTNSGTFDYFTEVVNGKEKLTRADYTGSEDDNVVLKGVIENKYALGYLGLAYYEAQKDQLGCVSVAAKKGDPYVFPTTSDVLTGKYPLSRPLFIYVKKSSLQQPHVKEFVDFYLRRPDLVERVKYVPLSPQDQLKERQKLESFVKAL